MKKKNKVLITSVVAIGIAAGSYFAFAGGGGSEVAMAYSGYKVTEKQIENAQNLAVKSFQTASKQFHLIQQKVRMN